MFHGMKMLGLIFALLFCVMSCRARERSHSMGLEDKASIQTTDSIIQAFAKSSDITPGEITKRNIMSFSCQDVIGKTKLEFRALVSQLDATSFLAVSNDRDLLADEMQLKSAILQSRDWVRRTPSGSSVNGIQVLQMSHTNLMWKSNYPESIIFHSYRDPASGEFLGFVNPQYEGSVMLETFEFRVDSRNVLMVEMKMYRFKDRYSQSSRRDISSDKILNLELESRYLCSEIDV